MARLRKTLSQNFLHDSAAVRRIIRSSALDPDALILEPGAGQGVLTRALADGRHRVIAYEIDPKLAAQLTAHLGDRPGLRLVQGDFLRARPPREPFAVVGNIPYSRTTDIVRWCLAAPCLTSATLLTQLEYARKHTGGYGRWPLLTVRTWPEWEWRQHGRVSRTSFTPVPRGDSAVLRVERRTRPLLPRATAARLPGVRGVRLHRPGRFAGGHADQAAPVRHGCARRSGGTTSTHRCPSVWSALLNGSHCSGSWAVRDVRDSLRGFARRLWPHTRHPDDPLLDHRDRQPPVLGEDPALAQAAAALRGGAPGRTGATRRRGRGGGTTSRGPGWRPPHRRPPSRRGRARAAPSPAGSCRRRRWRGRRAAVGSSRPRPACRSCGTRPGSAARAARRRWRRAARRRSAGRPRPGPPAAAPATPGSTEESAYRGSISAAVGSVSGSGAAGIGSWCSSPSSYVWKEPERWKIGWPCWTATTRRVVKERPSRMRSTV